MVKMILDVAWKSMTYMCVYIYIYILKFNIGYYTSYSTSDNVIVTSFCIIKLKNMNIVVDKD